METSFFTGIGHMCRFFCIAVFAVLSINASLNDTPITIKSVNLPVGNLIAFRAESTPANKILLKWKVARDDSFTYAIEKSRDGEKFIPAEGKTTLSEKTGEITWMDSSPRTINCYRVRMTDNFGGHSYSKALAMHYFKTGQVTLVTVTPDHSLDFINIDLFLKENAFVTMNIIDKENRIVLQRKENGKEGINQFNLKGTGNIAPGDYFLNVVVNGAEKLTVRLVKS
jgi:hypothetical protein